MPSPRRRSRRGADRRHRRGAASAAGRHVRAGRHSPLRGDDGGRGAGRSPAHRRRHDHRRGPRRRADPGPTRRRRRLGGRPRCPVEHRPETTKDATELVLRASVRSSFRSRWRDCITARTSHTARSPTRPPAPWRSPSPRGRSPHWSRSSSESCGAANPVRREGGPSRRRNAPHGRRPSPSRPPAPPRERSPASRARPSAVGR